MDLSRCNRALPAFDARDERRNAALGNTDAHHALTGLRVRCGVNAVADESGSADGTPRRR